MALISKLENIGNAIREKTGKTELLTLEQMPAEIAAIETGGGEYPEYWFSYSTSEQWESNSENIYIPCEGVNTVTFKYDFSRGNYGHPVQIDAYKGYYPAGLNSGQISWERETGYKTETLVSSLDTATTGVEITVDVSAYSHLRLWIYFKSVNNTNYKYSAIRIYDIQFN